MLSTRSVEFALYILALVTAVVRRMLKTQKTLGIISRVPSNRIKSLFVMFKT